MRATASGSVPARGADPMGPRRRRREEPAMTKLTLRATRYALSYLGAVAFGMSLN